MTEPAITIGGVKLTEAQAMTVRVALSNFASVLEHEEAAEMLGSIGKHYRKRVHEVRALMGNGKQ